MPSSCAFDSYRYLLKNSALFRDRLPSVFVRHGRRYQAVAFSYRKELVRLQVFQAVHDTCRPLDLDQVDPGPLSQAEEEAFVVAGAIARSAYSLAVLSQISGNYLEFRSYSIPVGLGPDQVNGDPIVGSFDIAA